MVSYNLLLSEQSLHTLIQYKIEVCSKRATPGFYLRTQLDLLAGKGTSLDDVGNEEFLQLLLLTKQITCFAESEILGDGSDWNATELNILGDISVAMLVDVYDNGVWDIHDKTFKIHNPPFKATLLFTPGPLLYGERFKGSTPDFLDISNNGQISQEKYNILIKRRVLPVFIYADHKAKEEDKKALIVLPGLGCGQFAGKFRGKMGEHLNKALQSIVKELPDCKNIACIRFDPFDECVDFEEVINNIKYRIRRGLGEFSKPQLSSIEEFEETKGEFENCVLFKIVAWDHASLPGNDYFLGSRHTDDGVASAATNSMEVLTAVKGYYSNGYYKPPENILTWEYVAKKEHTKLRAKGNVQVTLSDGTLINLNQFKTT